MHHFLEIWIFLHLTFTLKMDDRGSQKKLYQYILSETKNYLYYFSFFPILSWCDRLMLILCVNIYVNNELLGNNKYVFIFPTDENEEDSSDKTNWEHQNS